MRGMVSEFGSVLRGMLLATEHETTWCGPMFPGAGKARLLTCSGLQVQLSADWGAGGLPSMRQQGRPAHGPCVFEAARGRLYPFWPVPDGRRV